jgi:hypothetical protein
MLNKSNSQQTRCTIYCTGSKEAVNASHRPYAYIHSLMLSKMQIGLREYLPNTIKVFDFVYVRDEGE